MHLESAAALTIEQATALHTDEMEALTIQDLRFDEYTRERTARTWLWLRGFDPDLKSEEARKVRHEVLSDGRRCPKNC
jgi:hypothetical protein